jgi:hypothetical protein
MGSVTMALWEMVHVPVTQDILENYVIKVSHFMMSFQNCAKNFDNIKKTY